MSLLDMTGPVPPNQLLETRTHTPFEIDCILLPTRSNSRTSMQDRRVAFPWIELPVITMKRSKYRYRVAISINSAAQQQLDRTES
ncbi:hypothetical protein TWF225_003221 [Orbilia oligospora]|uniref:Uncharacterized protein n=1 Tax=Orbilia oligospora TaxID=2813651 RepID=A0A7C8TYM4_ORBOL|nr:hypothetical protein TWF751_005974 [Orbilia oligospora]KAF3188842.1 hypothetical protein TWF225_003221 [Orbilia oligospora]KAF3263012.1 hypothetical protein TWF128_001989 [Orbilia oligospora]KAF3267386.1 hypothetical protein TWF217_000451 [Orbilia oligospora]TGJ69163.1 hypothetical protein EYR41_005223 [Orbilia oligospora]